MRSRGLYYEHGEKSGHLLARHLKKDATGEIPTDPLKVKRHITVSEFV